MEASTIAPVKNQSLPQKILATWEALVTKYDAYNAVGLANTLLPSFPTYADGCKDKFSTGLLSLIPLLLPRQHPRVGTAILVLAEKFLMELVNMVLFQKPAYYNVSQETKDRFERLATFYSSLKTAVFEGFEGALPIPVGMEEALRPIGQLEADFKSVLEQAKKTSVAKAEMLKLLDDDNSQWNSEFVKTRGALAGVMKTLPTARQKCAPLAQKLAKAESELKEAQCSFNRGFVVLDHALVHPDRDFLIEPLKTQFPDALTTRNYPIGLDRCFLILAFAERKAEEVFDRLQSWRAAGNSYLQIFAVQLYMSGMATFDCDKVEFGSHCQVFSAPFQMSGNFLAGLTKAIEDHYRSLDRLSAEAVLTGGKISKLSIFEEKARAEDPEHKKAEVERLAEEEKQLLATMTQDIPLKAVKERAKDITYVESKKTSWRPPKWMVDAGDKRSNLIRDKWGIVVDGEDLPPPVILFIDFKMPSPILEWLDSRSIKKPTAIQVQGIRSVLLCGRDLIGVAFTGSGKTLVFALPMIMFALEEELKSPRASARLASCSVRLENWQRKPTRFSRKYAIGCYRVEDTRDYEQQSQLEVKTCASRNSASVRAATCSSLLQDGCCDQDVQVKTGKKDVLIATDLASKGLDFL